MATIQALNAKRSAHQRAYRVTVWAGQENSPGCRANAIIYGSSLPAAVSRALRAFRRDVGKGGRFTDWTVNVEPVRADETILPAVAHVGRPATAKKPALVPTYRRPFADTSAP